MTGISFPYSKRSAASINATVVKAAAGMLSAISAINTNSSPRYIHFYNQITAPNPAADSANHVFSVPVPGSIAGAGQVMSFPLPLRFDRGIAFVITTSPASDGVTAVAADEIFLNLAWS